jgi:hypothetical protein
LTGFAADCREEYKEYTLLYAFGRRKFGFRAWNVDGFVSILRYSGWPESLGMDLRFCFCSFCLWCEIGSYWRELQARSVCQAILSCDREEQLSDKIGSGERPSAVIGGARWRRDLNSWRICLRYSHFLSQLCINLYFQATQSFYPTLISK